MFKLTMLTMMVYGMMKITIKKPSSKKSVIPTETEVSVFVKLGNVLLWLKTDTEITNVQEDPTLSVLTHIQIPVDVKVP